jgi:hypothetical protein
MLPAAWRTSHIRGVVVATVNPLTATELIRLSGLSLAVAVATHSTIHARIVFSSRSSMIISSLVLILGLATMTGSKSVAAALSHRKR